MKLPFLLSGPILRRVEPTRVIIWLATSQPVQLKGHLFKIEREDRQLKDPSTIKKTVNNGYTYQKLDCQTNMSSAQLGEKLYIHLLEFSSTASPLPLNTFIGYNLFFDLGNRIADLKDFGLLDVKSPHSIVYKPFILPTFLIKKGETSHFLYGSCRKLHGKGNDALAGSDKLVNETAADVNLRPQALFFLGDQIYADDVAGPILPFLMKLGQQLIGGKRKEDLAALDARLALPPFKQAIKKVYGRQYMAMEFAKFTSSHAANHLLTFGEYAAMYLMNWNPVLWDLLKREDGFPSYNQLKASDQIYTVFPADEPHFKKNYKKENNQLKKSYKNGLNNVLNFLDGVPSVQRLLANTPTYMIFDDHDLTDDWNLSPDWKDKVQSSPLGRHIIANGLTAYWAFQGWGNSPDDFSPTFIQTIETYLSTVDVSSSSYRKWLDQMWTFSDWMFVAPTEPKTLFLDTRTMRGYDPFPEPVQVGSLSREVPSSAELIGAQGWEKTDQVLFKSGWQKKEPLIIVSATPLYGIRLFENFISEYIYPLRSFGLPVESSFDIEAWKDSGKGFSRFLEHLEAWDPEPCYILSGDVHYAFAARSAISFPSKQSKTYYQLTSSPLKNKSFQGFLGFLLRLAIKMSAIKNRGMSKSGKEDKKGRLTAMRQLVHDPTSFKWREHTHYHYTQNGQIVETKNNIGLLSIRPNSSDSIVSAWKNTFYDEYALKK
jgi:hypothetical protein